MKFKSVFCDTSFFIRLLDRNDALHTQSKEYFKYFIENNFELFISTIAIAEYCVGGDIHELPFKNLQIVPFNLKHAQRAGEFAKIIFHERNKGKLQVNDRKIIPNDTKLFAQADCEKEVAFYLSSDTESLKIYNLLKEKTTLEFRFIDLHIPYNEMFEI
ncbi:MAG: hypothetical protein LBE36_08715 [Flavobacteriaceae bacterium]|jgi:predicted nucleic acid-binding protein|nr:hypothetical protein [Flavobacteriaceae bacterium]